MLMSTALWRHAFDFTRTWLRMRGWHECLHINSPNTQLIKRTSK